MNRNARLQQARVGRRMADRATGNTPAITRFSAQKTAALMPNVSHLPCKRQASVLQNAEGEFYHLAGYSDPGLGEPVRSITSDTTSWRYSSTTPTFDTNS